MTGTTDDPDPGGPVGRGSDSTLSAALAELDDGCCVLVTGDVSDEAYRVASSRYFGAPQRRRQRVLALTTGGSESADPWLPDGVDTADDDAAVVRLDGAVRDPVAASDSDGPGPDAGPDRFDLDGGGPGGGDSTAGDGTGASDHETADGEPAAVREALLDAIEEVDTEPPNRLGLRVGVFRVDMLCATLGSDATQSLLGDVSQTTRDRGGMAHFHLPAPPTVTLDRIPWSRSSSTSWATTST
ncbi:hypothetical protein ACFQFH_07580 [Halobaculum halobium]|uniref:DUF7504 family protein n=1 Tax=Halobaculum halobium TaxID=3032281 RepID=UPI0036142D1B